MESYSADRKKMTTLYILEILKRYTDDTVDENGIPAHCLTQAQIGEKLYKDYEIILDRKAIARGLDDLIYSRDYADKIQYETKDRITTEKGKKVKTEYRTDFRYCHSFSTAQIRMLMDAVLFSKNIPYSECIELLELISNLGDIDARNRLTKHLSNLRDMSFDKVSNDQLLYNIGVIDEAIDQGKQIAYIYNNYGRDMKLHPRLVDGEIDPKVVNPYQMIATNGRYYLICNYDEYENTARVRIDKITDIEILDTNVKPKSKVKGLKDIPETMAGQLYMQPGTPERIVFRIANNERIISDIVDWFGKRVRFISEDGKTVTCAVKINPADMKFWAMQYSDNVEILEPESLRDNIRTSLREAWRKYNDGKDTLIESDENIKRLIAEWKQICEDAKAEKVDVKRLGALVRKTHLMLLPLRGEEIEGQYSGLVLGLNKCYKNSRTGLISNLNCVSLILGALLAEIDDNRMYRMRRNIPDDTLPIILHTGEDGRVEVMLDINNFEEGYLTLLQYTDKNAEEARKNHAILREKMKERHKEIMEQRRKEHEEKKKRDENS